MTRIMASTSARVSPHFRRSRKYAGKYTSFCM